VKGPKGAKAASGARAAVPPGDGLLKGVPAAVWAVLILAAAGVKGTMDFTGAERESLVGFLPSFWPLGISLAPNLLYVFLSAALAFFLLLLYDSVGLRLIVLLTGSRPRGVMRMVAAFAGYSVFAVALLGAALTGLWFTTLLSAALVLAAAACLPDFIRTVKEASARVAGFGRSLGPAGKVGWILVAAATACIVGVPEAAVDSMEYHLSFPQQVLFMHKLWGSGLYIGADMPIAVDFPNAFPVMLGLDMAAKALRPAMAILGALAFLRSLRLGLGASGQAEFVLVALLVPMARNFIVFSKSDGILMGAVSGLVAVLLEGGIYAHRAGGSAGGAAAGRGAVRPVQPGKSAVPPPPERAAFLVAGVLTGFLASGKYVVWPLLAALWLAGLLRLPYRGAFRSFLAAGAVAVLPLLPWLGRAYIFHADPFYPAGTVYLPSLFGVPENAAVVGETYQFWLGVQRPWENSLRDFGLLFLRNGAILGAALPLIIAGGRPGIFPFLTGSAVGLAGMNFALLSGIDFVERYAYPVFMMWNLMGSALLVSTFRPGSAASKVPVLWVVRVVMVIFGFRLVAGHQMNFPGIQPGEFYSGRLSVREFRLKSLYTYGLILPDLWVADALYPTRGSMVTVGNRFIWDIPSRAIGETFEPDFIWEAVNTSYTVEQLAAKFKKGNVRWILYNAHKAHWDAGSCTPKPWDERMVRLYIDFAVRYFTLTTWSGREDSWFGSCWLYNVARSPHPPSSRVLFLPGADRLFCRPVREYQLSNYPLSVAEFMALQKKFPELVKIGALMGPALLYTSQFKMAYPVLKETIKDGMVFNNNLLFFVGIALQLGKFEEADEVMAKAEKVYALQPDLLKGTRRIYAEVQAQRQAQIKAKAQAKGRK